MVAGLYLRWYQASSLKGGITYQGCIILLEGGMRLLLEGGTWLLEDGIRPLKGGIKLLEG